MSKLKEKNNIIVTIIYLSLFLSIIIIFNLNIKSKEYVTTKICKIEESYLEDVVKETFITRSLPNLKNYYTILYDNEYGEIRIDNYDLYKIAKKHDEVGIKIYKNKKTNEYIYEW